MSSHRVGSSSTQYRSFLPSTGERVGPTVATECDIETTSRQATSARRDPDDTERAPLRHCTRDSKTERGPVRVSNVGGGSVVRSPRGRVQTVEVGLLTHSLFLGWKGAEDGASVRGSLSSTVRWTWGSEPKSQKK